MRTSCSCLHAGYGRMRTWCRIELSREGLQCDLAPRQDPPFQRSLRTSGQLCHGLPNYLVTAWHSDNDTQ